ncbi:GDYXXLXY domain-containing protein [Aquimarina sp. TRL1]|uniref:GDYXXLXY domain-containing protein n=1 Tax=Aquimarina sp. (strain TRL1) TaxID=2736252 RepID=UPI00158F17F7|nr:GDYXXLXY domain-containing protein [Aquimarina sp. TRL1]QKX03844.1 GDYXXLXY domain-containing protein [Aquimarina sp. TRL1]
MKTSYVIIGFVSTALLQLTMSARIIWKQERVLVTGTAYKFKTAPIDPVDPFRGNYITLRFDENTFFIKNHKYKRGDKVRLSLKQDSEGFAMVTAIGKEDQPVTHDYIWATVSYVTEDFIRYDIPFNRFYMEEGKAKEAEIAYRDTHRLCPLEEVYALVYVREETAVLKDVYIKDIPIKEYVLQERASRIK